MLPSAPALSRPPAGSTSTALIQSVAGCLTTLRACCHVYGAVCGWGLLLSMLGELYGARQAEAHFHLEEGRQEEGGDCGGGWWAEARDGVSVPRTPTRCIVHHC